PAWRIGSTTATSPRKAAGAGVQDRSLRVADAVVTAKGPVGKPPPSLRGPAFDMPAACSNHLSADAWSPQDLAPGRTLARPLAAPGSKGLSLRRSRWRGQIASLPGGVSIALSRCSDGN